MIRRTVLLSLGLLLSRARSLRPASECTDDLYAEAYAQNHRLRLLRRVTPPVLRVKSGDTLRVTMQHVHGDVWPELAKHIGSSVAQQGISVLRADRSERPGLAGVVRQRNTLRDAAPQ